MSIDYVIIPEIDLCYARWRGVIDQKQTLENFARYLADPLYRPGRPELVDLREITAFDIDMSSMRLLLEQANAQDFGDQPGTLTVVLAGSAVSYGHARQYQSLASIRDGIDVRLHREEAQALRDLSRPERTVGELLRTHAPKFVLSSC